MKTSIILMAYPHPEWLKKTLWDFPAQSHKDFEAIIANNGYGNKTPKSEIF